VEILPLMYLKTRNIIFEVIRIRLSIRDPDTNSGIGTGFTLAEIGALQVLLLD